MNPQDTVELYVLKCAALKLAVDNATAPHLQRPLAKNIERESSLGPFISQFSTEMRRNAEEMAEYYKLFYMLENDIRRLIDDTMSDAHGVNWWEQHAPESVKNECQFNRQRESDAGVTSRSENPLDYVSFGQLGEIIRANWTLFGGILSNQKALTRILSGLNMLRGPIAHCGILAEDEIERLKLTVKDWFRLLEGPK